MFLLQSRSAFFTFSSVEIALFVLMYKLGCCLCPQGAVRNGMRSVIHQEYVHTHVLKCRGQVNT